MERNRFEHFVDDARRLHELNVSSVRTMLGPWTHTVDIVHTSPGQFVARCYLTLQAPLTREDNPELPTTGEFLDMLIRASDDDESAMAKTNSLTVRGVHSVLLGRGAGVAGGRRW